MKQILSILVIFTSLHNVFAADLNLVSGETAIIQANTRTTITCEGRGNGQTGGCQKETKNFNDLLNYCEKSATTIFCIDRLWTRFGVESPECKSDARMICLKRCETAATTMFCMDKCQ